MKPTQDFTQEANLDFIPVLPQRSAQANAQDFAHEAAQDLP